MENMGRIHWKLIRTFRTCFIWNRYARLWTDHMVVVNICNYNIYRYKINFNAMWWLCPQVSILLARFAATNSNKFTPFYVAGDLLIAMHFTLDPYLYVLQHWTLVKSICLRSNNRKNPRGSGGGSTSVSRSSSMRTTYEVFSQQPLWDYTHTYTHTHTNTIRICLAGEKKQSIRGWKKTKKPKSKSCVIILLVMVYTYLRCGSVVFVFSLG